MRGSVSWAWTATCSFWETHDRADTRLSGLVPADLEYGPPGSCSKPLEVQADIGFHEFEIGAPQRLLVTVEIWLKDLSPPADDDPATAWNYDFLRSEVEELAAARRYNLQETLAHAIFDRVAAFRGIAALCAFACRNLTYIRMHRRRS